MIRSNREAFGRHWDAFWFSPGSPRNLAAARIVFAATALWVVLSRNWYAVSGLPAELWEGVSVWERLRYLDFHGHPAFEHMLQWLAMLALLFAIVGLWPRLSCFIAGILLYHLAPLESIIWTPSPYVRGSTISVIALLTLSFSRCGDRWALQKSTSLEPVDLGEYTWPVRLIQLFICQIYFFSGYAKLFHSSWQWASAPNLRNWLLYFSEQDQVRVFHTLGPWLAEKPFLCVAVGIGTLVFELGFIGVLFSRKLRLLLVPLAALFHLGILLSMNLAFLNVPQLLIFADWDRVAGSFGSRRKPVAATHTAQLGVGSARG